MKKKFVSMFLVLIALFTLVSSASAAQFPTPNDLDITGYTDRTSYTSPGLYVNFSMTQTYSMHPTYDYNIRLERYDSATGNWTVYGTKTGWIHYQSGAYLSWYTMSYPRGTYRIAATFFKQGTIEWVGSLQTGSFTITY